MWRHLFAAIPAAMLLVAVARTASPDTSYNRPLTAAERQGLTVRQPAKSPATEWGVKIALGLCAASAVYFFVDAIRREITTGKTTALAIAFVGMLTFGFVSLLYYAIWGRHPLRPAADVYGDGRFCPRCLARSTDRPAPGTVVYNAIYGTQPMGAADRCDACKSVVRTIWLWLIVPLVPIGSYRMIATERNHYVGRRTSLRWSQVLPVYGIVLVLAAVVGYAALN